MKKGTVYFFTGLSGAGKTTIGTLFYNRLLEHSPQAVRLDGDTMRAMMDGKLPLPDYGRNFGEQYRKVLANGHDYTYEGRLKGAVALFDWCKELSDLGVDVVCCSICMYDSVREWNRKNIENYREIYIKVTMETLYQRDQKGLYSSGTKNVVGVDIPAEEPKQPDVVVENNGDRSPQDIEKEVEKELGLCW